MIKNNFSILIEKIKQFKKEYGTITMELTFHHNELTKVKIIDRSELLIFEKENKNEKTK